MLNEITPLILTYNEAPNIGRTLEQLRWASDIVVVDSFSDDRTLEIVSSFPQTRVFQRAFDSFAKQCNFGLKETGIKTEWVLNLDADYVLTREFVTELRSLQPGPRLDRFRAPFIYCINGRRLRSGVYPPVTVLFRHSKGYYVDDGHAHRVVVNGEVAEFQSNILHDDRKPFSRWLQSQAHYAAVEAKKIIAADPAELAWPDRLRRLRAIAPLAMFFYCLVVRGGIFDGRAGVYYAFQRMLAELMLSLYLLDHDLRKNCELRMSNCEFQTSDIDPQLTRNKLN